MSATINTFPPFQSMTSPRGWILAVIVLLHLGFYWLLSSGMGQTIIQAFIPPAVYVDVSDQRVEPEPLPRPTKVDIDIDETPHRLTVAPPEFPNVRDDDDVGPRIVDSSSRREETGGETTQTPTAPVISLPEIDPRIGLSEPAYPPSEIRAGHTGTALISVHVLENGRVGDVKLDQSSGYERLDASAMREARRWRFKPGMSDGKPVAMWKQVPITFQLQERDR